VLTWGKRRGFVPESCYEPSEDGMNHECPEDHLTENSCRQTNNFYKVIDFCLAQTAEGIKKEILTNGPVVGQITPNTDFLTYHDGIYARSQDSFRFNGNHVLKVVGWEKQADDSDAWIVMNTWGEEWGDQGYAKIHGNGETSLDFYAISMSTYPLTMADYYQQQ